MALSNIAKEPRRELTESVLGVVTFVGLIWLDYEGAVWMNVHDTSREPIPVWIAMVVIVIFLVVAFLVLTGLTYLTHWIGEVVCRWMAKVGLDPRPKQRYR